MRRNAVQDRFDPVVQRAVLVEHFGPVEQADATDGATKDQVVMGRGGQGSDE